MRDKDIQECLGHSNIQTTANTYAHLDIKRKQGISNTLSNVLNFNKLVNIINRLGYGLKIVDGTEFTKVLRQTAERSGMEHIFETFINDMDENDQLNYDSNIRIKNDFTVQYLKNLGFEWSDIGIDYLRKYIEYFRKIGLIK